MPRLPTTLESRSTCVTSFIAIISNNYAEKAARKVANFIKGWHKVRVRVSIKASDRVRVKVKFRVRFDNKNMGCV